MYTAIINEEVEMNFRNPAQSYLRPRANVHFLQALDNQKVFSLSGDRKLWISVGKMLLVLCPLLLAMNLWLASSFNNFEQSVQALELVHQEHMDSQNNLRTKRDQLLSPERVRVFAAEKFALHAPKKEQVN
jgi:hypothetical protein